jgi:CheY-like chemotaxis protein
VHFDADPARIAQVLGNLLSNASKFSPRGGRIGLSLEVAGSEHEQPQQAILRVRDSGIGIAADQLPHIFDMFMQVDTSLERSQSGLGIGLTLVKNLVEMHEGSVEAHSAGLGHGSEFVVRLPLLKDEGGGMKDGSDTGHSDSSFIQPASSLRVLIVDDNRDSADSLAMLLRLTGHQTHVSYDGLAGLEAAEKFQPEVALLDIGLPKLNGYEVCRRIRQQPWGKTMLLVALTGWGHAEDRKTSSAAGFDAHLVKPVEYEALKKLLSGLKATI